jgi:hypothetical protein
MPDALNTARPFSQPRSRPQRSLPLQPITSTSQLDDGCSGARFQPIRRREQKPFERLKWRAVSCLPRALALPLNKACFLYACTRVASKVPSAISTATHIGLLMRQDDFFSQILKPVLFSDPSIMGRSRVNHFDLPRSICFFF